MLQRDKEMLKENCYRNKNINKTLNYSSHYKDLSETNCENDHNNSIKKRMKNSKVSILGGRT
jgi:hypothetical protein